MYFSCLSDSVTNIFGHESSVWIIFLCASQKRKFLRFLVYVAKWFATKMVPSYPPVGSVQALHVGENVLREGVQRLEDSERKRHSRKQRSARFRGKQSWSVTLLLFTHFEDVE